MLKNKKKISIYMVILIIFISVVYQNFHSKPINLPYISAKSVAVFDLNRNQFIYEANSQDIRGAGSITKLMTIFIILDEIEKGNLKQSDTITFTPQEVFTLGSKYGGMEGETFTVEQLLAGVLLSSGCDCVQALVRMTFENEENFVEQMNQKAKELNLTRTNFENATGIDQAVHYTSAEDIILLSTALLKQYPSIIDYTSAQSLEIDGKFFKNTNQLLGTNPNIKGLKTGTTQLSGYNLVTFIEDEKNAYLIVLLDSNDDYTLYSETYSIIEAIL